MAKRTQVDIAQEFQTLHAQYEEEMTSLRHAWLLQNNPFRNHPDCYEVMRESDRRGVAGVITSFEAYMTPIAEKWWKDRGWTMEWPTKTEPCCKYTKDKA